MQQIVGYVCDVWKCVSVNITAFYIQDYNMLSNCDIFPVDVILSCGRGGVLWAWWYPVGVVVWCGRDTVGPGV